MISFRYHLVSLVAVFLALALGIVVGTVALSGPITKDLKRQKNRAVDQRDTLDSRVKVLQNRLDDADQFASTYGAQLVAGRLTGQNVIEIVLPGATSDMADGVSHEVSAAGGTITGRLTITKAYLDPARGAGITSLATGAAHPVGLTLPETPNADELGGALLAYVLLGNGAATDVTQVLGGFSELHMITLADQDLAPAKNVVVVGRGVVAAKDYAGRAEQSLVAALAKAGGHVVVAGDDDAATGGGLIALLRSSGDQRKAVSAVDNADGASGQVATVLALAGSIKGQVGQYGTGEGADALFPPPSK